MQVRNEDTPPAAPAHARDRGRWPALGVGGLGLLLAQLDGLPRTVGALLLVVAVAAQLGADALARVLTVLPPVLRELPRRPGADDGSGPGEPSQESQERPRGRRSSR